MLYLHPFIQAYVRHVERINRLVGRCMIYVIFLMIGLLIYSSISRTVSNVPLIWGVEISQFILAAYYLLGGGYSMQLDAHVRMDLLYSRQPARTRAFADSLTAFCLVFYLTVLLIGGISSTNYAIEYGQKNYSSWAPPLAPIKIIMTIGIALMLLQAIAIFFKDLARARGKPLP
jgi:TRAP-type mannitol/chloroaromatic compound transport system permease small subunit